MAHPGYVLDENMSHAVSRILNATGLPVDTAQELGLTSASDVRVLLSAMRLGKPVVTQNKDDFLLLHEVWSSLKALWEAEVLLFTGAAVSFSTHAGIVIIPPIPIYDAAALLLDLTVAQPQLQGRCLRWLPQTGWQEPLPMSGARVN